MKPQLPKDSASVVQNALYFVHLSNAAYLGNPQKYDYAADCSFDDFQLDKFKTFPSDDGSDFAFAGRIDGALLVSFRGTANIEGWWHDFQFRQVADYDGLVHEGFYNSTESIWDDLKGHLDKIWTRDDVVWITGHSLGGAMATVFAKWLAHARYDIAGVHTFGQPRVGNNDYADAYSPNAVHYRFVNDKDIVPQVPPRWLGPGIFYKHVGKLQLFDEDGNLSRSDKAWSELAGEFAGSMLTRGPMPKAKMPDFGFEDHPIGHYIEKIEGYLNG
jgi:hypothetical protein